MVRKQLSKLAATLVFTLFVSVLSIVVGSNHAHAFLIDGFGDTQAPCVQINDGASSCTDTDVSDSDFSSATRQTDGVAENTFDALSAFYFDSKFHHDQGSGDWGKTTVTWSDFGNADLTDGGISTQIGLSFVTLDSGLSGNQCVDCITLTFTDSSANEATVSYSFSTEISDLWVINMGDAVFTAVSFDWENVTSVVLMIDGITGGPGNTALLSMDIEIDLFETIPEPATLLLFGIGLLGTAFIYRRRRRKVSLAPAIG